MKEYPQIAFDSMCEMNYSEFDVWNDFDFGGAENTRVAGGSIFHNDEMAKNENELMNDAIMHKQNEWSWLNDSYYSFMDIPIIGKLSNLGVLVWCVVFCACFILYECEVKVVYIVMPALITIVENVTILYNGYLRYFCPVIATLPFILLGCLVFGKEYKKE